MQIKENKEENEGVKDEGRDKGVGRMETERHTRRG